MKFGKKSRQITYVSKYQVSFSNAILSKQFNTELMYNKKYVKAEKKLKLKKAIIVFVNEYY